MKLERAFQSRGWWCGAAWLWLLLCGPSCNGTESGNPINPPGPPSVHEPDDTGDDVTDGSDLGVDDGLDEPATGFDSPNDDAPVDDGINALDDDQLPDFSDDDLGNLDDAVVVDDDARMVDDGDDDLGDDSSALQDEAADDSDTPRNPDLDPDVDDGRPMFPDGFSDDIAEADDGAIMENPGVPDGDMTSPSAGGSSEVGGGDQCAESSCQGVAEQQAQQLSRPTPVPASFSMSACEEAPQESSCECSGSNVVVKVTTGATGCALAGRFGICLYDASEFAGCTSLGGECQALCAELDHLRQADAERTIDVSVRRAACLPSNQCAYLLETETTCLRGPELAEVDCSMSDEELLGLPQPAASDAGADGDAGQ